ncbi:hypothetical protein IWZ00DRAFT_377336 [Phyllosticta capitalensis]
MGTFLLILVIFLEPGWSAGSVAQKRESFLEPIITSRSMGKHLKSKFYVSAHIYSLPEFFLWQLYVHVVFGIHPEVH